MLGWNTQEGIVKKSHYDLGLHCLLQISQAHDEARKEKWDHLIPFHSYKIVEISFIIYNPLDRNTISVTLSPESKKLCLSLFLTIR